MEENKKSYKKYYLLLIPLLLLIAFLGYWQISSIYGEGFEYETEKVKEETLEVKVSGTGTIIAPEEENIKSEISGTVEEILVNKGDQVEEGQEIIKIENDELEAIKAERWAEYLEAVEDLEKTNINPDALQSEEDSGEANKESAKLNYELAEEMVSKKSILSPIAGTVSDINIKVGDSIELDNKINSKSSAVLLTIINFDNLEAKVEINEKDLPKVTTNQEVTLSLDALGDKNLNGYVSSVEGVGVKRESQVTYNAFISINNIEGNNIKPGMSVEALISINKERNLLLIPNDALNIENDRYYVEVLQSGTPKKRIIKIGLSNDKYTQVLDGLKVGEEVVVEKIEKNLQSNILKAIRNF